MSKHTPGPWNISESLNGKRLVSTAKGETIAQPIHSFHSENEANAHLIAAAPELLAALKDLKAACKNMTSIDRLVMALDKANEAIAKAEGDDK